MKTLIIVVHPNLTESVINKNWFDELFTHGNIFIALGVRSYLAFLDEL